MPGTLLSEVIRPAFIPTVAASVSSMPIGTELILVEAESGMVHVLNPTAAIVWQCFDGESSLEDISVDLADAFDKPLDGMRKDVLLLARSAGEAGLLEGIATGNVAIHQMDGAVPIGESAFTSDGRPVHRSGHRTLLVNWSSSCSYCLSIFPMLLTLHPALEESDVDVVLVDDVDLDRTVRLLEESRLALQVISPVMSTTRPVGLFSDLGTPCAYLLDAQGCVDSPLAYGADKVINLVRSVTGGDPRSGGMRQLPRLLSVGSGVCRGNGTGGPNREWLPTGVYRVGAYDVGIRAGSPWAADVVAKALARHCAADDVPAPANFSIALSDPDLAGRRDLSFLLRDTQVVSRSRSPRRVLMTLAAHLSSLLEPENGLRKVECMATVFNEKAILLPAELRRSIDQVEPKLARTGFALVDDPQPCLDFATAEVVVREPAITLDQDVVAALADPAPSPSEPSRVPAGRYPLTAWFLPVRDETGRQLSPAGAVAAAVGTMVAEPAELPFAVDECARLLQGIDVRAIPANDTTAALNALLEWLPGAS